MCPSWGGGGLVGVVGGGGVVEGWGRGGVLFFGAEFAWVKAGRVGGGHVWGHGGWRDEVGGYGRWINGSL